MSAVIKRALAEVEQQIADHGEPITDCRAMRTLASLWLAGAEREMFGVIAMDTRHRMIDREVLFLGSVNRCHVHTREVMRYLLKLNAAAFVLVHNHPSGVPEPSQSDVALTRELKDMGERLDTILLDHIVVAGTETVSMASRGLV